MPFLNLKSILFVTLCFLSLTQGFFHSAQLQSRKLIKRSSLDMGLGKRIGGIFKRKSDDNLAPNDEVIIKSSDEKSKATTLLGNVPIKFTCGDKEVQAWAFEGQPLSDVAASVDVFIRYKCKKGECGTCEVQHNGKWIKTCQTNIPHVANGESFDIRVREVSASQKGKKPSTFFSPASFVEGVVNNGLGVVGFINEGRKADDEFSVRMEREAKIAALVEAQKKQKAKEDGMQSA